MAADYRKLVAELLAFHDFKGKTVLTVGAGGGRLVEYGRGAGRVLALDNDARALDELRKSAKAAGLEDKFEPILGDFFEVDLGADIVLFEFCLHEMSDPGAAVERALGMAPAVVVFDHWLDSEWTYVAGEEEKVAASWAALARFPIVKKERRETVQFFSDYGELFEKVKGQGETALARIAGFRGKTGIRIPMSYGLALVAGRHDEATVVNPLPRR